jgi:vacuolar protein sorting-associated protein 72
VKKPKTPRRAPTQEELLKRAQKIEQKNVIEHRDYLKDEDERRQRARVVRPVIKGRLVRWVSKVEEEIVPLPQPESPMHVARASHEYLTPAGPSTSYTTQPYTLSPGRPPHWGHIPTTPGSSSPGAYTALFPHNQPSHSNSLPPPSTPPTSNATRPLEPFPAVVQRKRKIAKNYVVLENAQMEKAPRVTWKQTMEGMFGDHVKWEDVKAYTTKNRPMCEFLSCLNKDPRSFDRC